MFDVCQSTNYFCSYDISDPIAVMSNMTRIKIAPDMVAARIEHQTNEVIKNTVKAGFK